MSDSQRPSQPPNFEEKLAGLRSTDPSLVRWMILQNPKEQPRDGEFARAQAVAYLSMVDIEMLLDDTFGAAGWCATYSDTGAITICRIALKTDSGEWVAKEDGCGDDTDHEDARKKGRLDMALKANLSDAFKRAARRWGIGRDLAYLPKPWVDCRPMGRSWVIANHEEDRLHQIAETRQDPGRNDRRPAQQRDERPREEPRQERRDDRRQGQPQPQGQGNGGRGGGNVWRIPFGKTRGTPIGEADTKDLLGSKKIIEANLANNKSENPRRDEAWLKAVGAELERRKAERAPQPGNGQRRPDPPPQEQPRQTPPPAAHQESDAWH